MRFSHFTIGHNSNEELALNLAFYKKLGFEIVELVGDSQVWIHDFSNTSGLGATIELVVRSTEGIPVSDVSFAVPDLENKFSMMKSAGITCTMSKPFMKKPYVSVYDRVGNLINLEGSIKFAENMALANAKQVRLSENTNSESNEKVRSCLDISAAKRIGMLTSGGDSSGMNASVRAMTRIAIARGCIPFAIYEGFQGLVDGGDKIKQFGWEDVRGFLSKGGTQIGTARCAAFRSRSGRLDAAFNLVKNGIDALVVVGGDGSLTGANILRQEWTGLIDELVSIGRLTVDESANLRSGLSIVGLVGSIDNDMSATDITIGAVTSLHRICESVDSLASTASSHQRAFVVEVMGRHCGWLALMAAIAVGADWVCLPERPPPQNVDRYENDWQSELCDIVKQCRKIGNRKTIIVVCEGAIDRNLNPIKAHEIRKVLEDRLGLDTRVTTLGHVQRGGKPCAFDRYLATSQGAHAIDAILHAGPDDPAPMIGMSNNKIVSVPLMEAVKLTQSVTTAIAAKDFKTAMEHRDPDFKSSFDAFINSTRICEDNDLRDTSDQLRIGIIHVGAPAGGMNAATRIAARLCLSKGFTPVGIKNGFLGLVKDEIIILKWQDVIGWQTRGGSELGCNRGHPQPLSWEETRNLKDVDFIDLGSIAYHLQKHKISALLFVGGFEAYTSQLTLTMARSAYPAFCIPMILIPATVSNNVPGTEYSLGSDTALNVIVEACDRIKISANASRKRVFVIEVQGGNCGYLATLGSLVSGASATYIPENGISLKMLQDDIVHLKKRYLYEDQVGLANEGRIVIRAESTKPAVYDTETVSGILVAESEGIFDSRTAILGHLQQGDIPSPLDRVRATRQASECIDWITDAFVRIQGTTECTKSMIPIYTTQHEDSCIIGIQGANIEMTPIPSLAEITDMKNRRSKNSWWLHLGLLNRTLAKRID